MWFWKKSLPKTDNNSDKEKKDSGIFAERDKVVPKDDDSDAALRMFRYTKIEEKSSGEITQNKTVKEQRDEMAKAQEEARQGVAKVNVMMSNRKNDMIYEAKVEADKQLTPEERKKVEEEGLAWLSHLDRGIKNKDFLTYAEAKDRKTKAQLSDQEIIDATAKIRNVGFMTEVEAKQRVLTAEEKAEQDRKDREAAAEAISALQSASFYKKNDEGQVEKEQEEQEQVEGEGEK